MEFTEERSEPRYSIRAGFIEIHDRPLPLADLSTRGLGFRSEAPESFAVSQEINGFLILQSVEEQYEMPVHLIVRRIEGDLVGCSMTCKIPHHGATITEFLERLRSSAV